MATLNWKTPNGTTGSLNLANIVTTDTTQTITGQKIFNQQIMVNRGAAVKGTPPSAVAYPFWLGVYETGTGTDTKNRFASIGTTINKTSGNVQMELIAYKNEANSSSTANLGVVYPTEGDPYAFAPTPTQTDDSTKIATTAYVKDCVPKSIGSATQPVYTNANGVITKCTYTLSKSVPSDAVFTDHTYSNMTAATASAAGTAGLVPAPAAGKQTSFLRGDGTWVIPTDTDTKVTSTVIQPTSSTTWYALNTTESTTGTGTAVKNPEIKFVLLQGTASADGYARLYLGNTTATGTAGNKTGGILLYNNQGKYTAVYPHAGDTTNRTIYTPKSGGTLVVHTTDTAIGGTATPVYISAEGVATAISADVGSATNPVYLDGGTIKKTTYTLSKSVPSDAVFTDHTYSNMTAATASAAGTAGLVPAPAKGKQASFLRGDATWAVPTDTTYSTFVKSGSTAAAGLVPKPSTTAGTTKYLREDATWVVPPDHTYSNFVKSGSSAAAGLVPKPSTTAGTTKYLREDCTWQVPPDTNTTYSAGTAALLTAGTDTTNRVWTAKILSDFVESKCTPGSSIAANGYVKLDSGLIIQWGTFDITSNVETKWPITFPNVCFCAVVTTTPLAAEGGDSVIVSKTGFTTDVWFSSHQHCYCIGLGM